MKAKTNENRLFLALQQALLLCAFFLVPVTVTAQYDYQLVIPPGAESAQSFGLNNKGQVTGGFNDGSGNFSYIYDMKKDSFEIPATDASMLDISNSETTVGDINAICTIRDKDGTITSLSPPSYAVDSFCQLRGINSRGQVVGFMVSALGEWLGFSYDPKKDEYDEFLPSSQTFAHEINAKGEIVGSVNLEVGEAFAGSPSGRYGYRRDKKGNYKYFAISQAFPGQSRARGISESGLVTGFYVDAASFELKSYVVKLAKNNDYEDISLTAGQIVHRKPCNPDIPAAPGAGYDLFTDMTAARVRNDGVVVGSCFDTYFNSTTGDSVSYVAGFIATPTK